MEKFQTVDADSDDNTENAKVEHRKKQRFEIVDDGVRPENTTEDDWQREKAAINIQTQHEKFMDVQMKKAEQYRKRKRKLAAVSSKASVIESASMETCRPGMEGKGPRLVPQSVKNYRKRLKKKRSRTKQSTI